MKRYPTPLLMAALGLFISGTLTAKNAPTFETQITVSKAPEASVTPAPVKAAPAKPAGRLGRPQPTASRSFSGLNGGRNMEGVLLTSPKAIWVEKAARRLTVFQDGVALKTYLTTIGRNELAFKQKSGDWATPEGLYRVRKKNPQSKYYLALHIDYPNQMDAARGLSQGLINAQQYNSIVNAIAKGAMPPQNTRLGYYIEIHGGSNKVKAGPDGQPLLAGWTRGCMGLRDVDIREIYAWAPVGTPVLITP